MTDNNNNNIWHTDHFWHSAEQDKIINALLKFHRCEIRVNKDRTVPVGGNRTRSYTTLDEILKTVKPVLAECGIFIIQSLAGGDVITILMHESGQFIASRVGFVPMTGNNTNNLQNAGGGLTYLKRYCISSMLSINAEDDDDGASSSGTVITPLKDEQIPKIKKAITEGYTIEQIKQKYSISTKQLELISHE